MSRRTVAVGIAAMVALAVLVPTSAVKADCTFMAELMGCVVDKITGLPIENAMVCMLDLCDPGCMIEPWLCGLCDSTDASGCFAVSKTCITPVGESFPEAYCINIYADGYNPDDTCQIVFWFAPCLDSAGLDTNYFPLDFGTIELMPDSLDRGDVNGDGSVNVADVFYLIDYAFRQGPPPASGLWTGDVNCSGGINLADVVRLIDFVFRNGPPLVCL